MSESDRLRSMLDERGVEYRTDDASYTFATHWTDGLGRGCSFVEEMYDGKSKTIFVSEPSARNITPEQAIAATLGEVNDDECYLVYEGKKYPAKLDFSFLGFIPITITVGGFRYLVEVPNGE